ncbi:hypothetical protein Dsin_012750 [Dipteronia sinensis]|uniref:CCHC-type domain-containing protein n=1 Tax=Dipteronia sinensis TaxID=43782 RepID=A0AAE0AJF7_9ROSI|nr:hypothetical protein Dsin_012750 [Dipteronia sinensis]
MIGEVKEIDTGKSGDCVGKYIRVRVVVRVDKPLRRILRLDVVCDGKESVMLLWYERLTEHCFRCGRLGHVVRDCLEARAGDGPKDFDHLFGPWLKADSPVKLGKFRQQGEGGRYENDRNTHGSLESGPLGSNDLTDVRDGVNIGSRSVRLEVDADRVATVRHVEDSLVIWDSEKHFEREGGRVGKRKEYYHTCRILGDNLSNEEVITSIPKRWLKIRYQSSILRKVVS